MSDTVAIVLCVAITAGSLVGLMWIAGQPYGNAKPDVPVVRCDDELPSLLPGAPVLCEKPEGHSNAHRNGDVTWLVDPAVRAS